MVDLKVTVSAENFGLEFPYDESKSTDDYVDEFYTVWAKTIIRRNFSPFVHDHNIVLTDEFVDAIKADLIEYGDLYDFEEFLKNYINNSTSNR